MIASDIGRPLSHLAQTSIHDGLLEDAAGVLETLVPVNVNVKSEEGRWYARRTLPYRTQDNRIDGVVITFVDVTDAKLAEQHLAALNADLERRVAERSAIAEQHTERLRRLAAELFLTEERERRRLAGELHDGLGQYLAALQMRLSLANQGNDALLAECQQLLGEANRLVRTMTFALSPPVLSDLGFPAAIDWLADEMKRLHNLTVRVDTQRLQVRLRDEAALILFRAVGELLTNVAKHAGVNEATLVVREEGDQLVLLVGDHGRGFSPEQLERGAEQQTFGLFNVRERVGHLGGGLTIACGGPGAAVTITVPLAAVAEPGSEPTDRG